MSEISRFWGGTTTGDAQTGAPYDNSELAEFFEILLPYDRDANCIVYGYGNNLAVTNPSANIIRIASGAALVHGYLYINSATTDVSITAPTGGTSIYYYTIRLRCDTSLQTVRATEGQPGVGGYPSCSWSAPWFDIPICYASITDAGVVTLTQIADSVKYLHPAMMVSGYNLDTDTVDDDKIRYRVPVVRYHQGGNTDTWSTGGTSNYDVTRVEIQCGASQILIGQGAKTVYFPVAFSYPPLVFIQPTYSLTDYWAGATGITTTEFTITLCVDFLAVDATYYWMAIGPVA